MNQREVVRTGWILWLSAWLVLSGGGWVQAQSKTKRVIQLSGMLLAPDTDTGVPGAHVYVPKAGYGTTSNPMGFFTMPVVVGDSVVISAVGFVKQHYIVPNHKSDFLTIIVDMVEDVTYLQEIVFREIPTEEVFKEAVLALNIPLDQRQYDPRNLNAELMALMLKTTPMDGAANYKYYMDQWSTSSSDKFQPRTNPFLNPFNWARFFRDVRQQRR